MRASGGRGATYSNTYSKLASSSDAGTVMTVVT
jgi:hypothetical protein